jgi:hypothetical protein
VAAAIVEAVRGWFFVVLCAGMGLVPASTRAQDGPVPAGRPPELGFDLGYGFGVHLDSGPSDTHFVIVTPSLGVRVSPHVEYFPSGILERYFTPQNSYFVGLIPLGARISIGTGGKFVPFFDAGLGFGWTNLDRLLEISRRFNFRAEAGVGLRGDVSDTDGWTVRVRFFHTSNGGTADPNLGLNHMVVSGGWRFR